MFFAQCAGRIWMSRSRERARKLRAVGRDASLDIVSPRQDIRYADDYENVGPPSTPIASPDRCRMQVLPDQLRQTLAALLRVLGWIAAAVSALVLLAAIAARLDRPTMNFHSYFTAAHLLVEGQPIS